MSDDERIRVAVVAPAFNESGKIGRVVRKIRAAAARDLHVLLEPVVVDDSSTDDTAEQAREAGATVLRHDQNQGVGAGIRTGIDYALTAGHDIVVIISGDDQHEPEQIHRVLAPLLSHRCDFVQGSRYALMALILISKNSLMLSSF